MTAPVLALSDLRVELDSGAPVVDGVSLSVAPGEIVGLVGESGSGKTTTALALLGYASPGVRVVAGDVSVAGEQVSGRSEAAMRPLRGRTVSYVPQDPGNALNPARRIGDALRDMLRAHAEGRLDFGGAVPAALANVHLPVDPAFARRYPHQLSGGQQQRVCISIALVCEPPVVVLDEPTTGLDVITQARILDEIERLRREHDVAMVYVSHDLAVVARLADRVAVMYAGRIVEAGPTAAVLAAPRHPYTRGLIASIPDHEDPRPLQAMPGVALGVGERLAGCSFAPRCPLVVDACRAAMPPLDPTGVGHEVRCLRARETVAVAPAAVPVTRVARTRDARPLLQVSGLRAEHASRHDTVVAAADVSFAIHRGASVALVGESGSGKTTIARVVAGLHPLAAGELRLDGTRLPDLARRRTAEQRRRIQIIFQNPADALNPRHSVGEQVARPARLLRGLSRAAARAEAIELLERVRLPAAVARRYPAELSGGERQRIGIARALAAHPDLLICDEVTSALDVSVQAAVLTLLSELRDDLGLGLLFITHDLGVMAAVADEVLVLERGAIRESGPTATVLRTPRHDYTRRLLAVAPALRRALPLDHADPAQAT